jgi:methionyl aminopeptidase
VLSSKNKYSQLFGSSQHIELKSSEEIAKLRLAGKEVARVLKILEEHLAPGVSTQYIDDIAFNEIRSLNMKPAFLGYHGFPASTCISINEELVHGIPHPDRIIKDGDIVTIDLGIFCQGYCGDMAKTFGVGIISAEAQRLLEVTKTSLDLAIKQVRPSNRLGDVSWAVQQYAEKNGYGVVRDYVGHGIGRQMHEDPAVPNFGSQHTGIRLLPGMVICIEPMLNAGSYEVKTLSDGWTVVTVDGKLCAHFEHMVAVTENGHEVLTTI